MAIDMPRHRSPAAPIEWLDGVPLRSAWYVFASDYAKSAYNGSPGRKVMIVLDMWADLADGKLLAYGDCVKPEENASDGPVLLPSHMFQDAPPFNIGDDNTIEISGWRYERVRISRISSLQLLSDCDLPPETSHLTAKRGGGRPNIYGLSKPIIEILFEVEFNRTLSAAKLHPAFELEFQRRYSRGDYQIDPPRERSLRTYLDRYREELAETGK